MVTLHVAINKLMATHPGIACLRPITNQSIWTPKNAKMQSQPVAPIPTREPQLRQV